MKRSPIARYTRLPAKRSKPRRKAPERVTRERTRPRAGQGPTPEQRAFHDSLRGLPCQCGCGRPGEAVHHLLSGAPGKVGRRDHDFVVILAHHCHNGGTKSVHGLGSEAAFKREHGADLVTVAVENLRHWRVKAL